MACPVCGKTMQSIGLDDPNRRTWWCAGCGSLKEMTGDFSRVELPGDLRHVIEAAGLSDGRFGGIQSTTVKAAFNVRREGGDPPTVEMVIFDHLGRRQF